jgi:NADH-quinone oxidoreductase subunit L
MLDFVWLIPALPAAAFVVIGLFTRRSKDLSSYLAIGAVGISALVAFGVFSEVYARSGTSHPITIEEPFERTLAWANLGPWGQLPFGWLVDPLTAIMLVVVAPVSFLIQIFSRGYLRGSVAAHTDTASIGHIREEAQEEEAETYELGHAAGDHDHGAGDMGTVDPFIGTEFDLDETGKDRGYSRFFAYISLFTMAMLGLVLANNLLTLFVFWEVVGIGSFLLIGFWYGKTEAAMAAKKAFITTRFGDFGMLIGILIVWAFVGNFEFGKIREAIESHQLGGPALTAAALLLFAGAVGKSAQFPLHVWLPDAMEGPTPVSALIHAATMVAAGVYLVARTFFMFEAAPQAALVVAIIGGFTAIFAATMGLVNRDIKRVMAFSTVSQLGYMMLALGASALAGGAIAAGIFHLFTHAFFKALLFLTAGSVIHSVHTQDIFEMGGLRRYMPITFWTMLIGALSLAGIPPFSGFWSKDEVLAVAWNHGQGNMVLFAFAMITVFLTAFYMFRVIFLTFFGPRHASEQAGHSAHGEPHESPPTMAIPLLLLAIPSVVIGLWGAPFLGSGFQSFLEGHAVEEAMDPFVAGFSTILALAGIGLAAAMYWARAISPATVARAFGPIYGWALNRWYVDELYNWLMEVLILKPAEFLAYVFDRRVIDGIVNGIGRSLVALSAGIRGMQTGRVQNYGFVLFAGLVIMALSFIVGRR